MNPYEVLEIPPGSSAEDIKAAYHRMAKQWHPDRFTGEAKVEAERRFRHLAEAFSMLKDVGRREEAERAAGAAAGAATPAKAAAPIMLDHGASQDRSPQNKTVDEWFKEAKEASDAKAYERALGLVQYAIRLDGERGDFHALYGKLLDLTGGDKRLLVRTLETAVRLNPKDVETTILLAQTFQSLGMHARASRLWNVVHNLAPTHAIFTVPSKKAGPAGVRAKAEEGLQGLGEQFTVLIATAKDAVSKIFKRG